MSARTEASCAHCASHFADGQLAVPVAATYRLADAAAALAQATSGHAGGAIILRL